MNVKYLHADFYNIGSCTLRGDFLKLFDLSKVSCMANIVSRN